MKWSFKLTRLTGIDVYVHDTFFILVTWFALIYWQPPRKPGSKKAGVYHRISRRDGEEVHRSTGVAGRRRRYARPARDQ